MPSKISRRDFLKGSAAAAMGAAFFGLGRGLSAAAEEIPIYVPGTYSASAAGYSSDVTVTLKGSGDLIYCALYEINGRSYSIGATKGLSWRQLEEMLP